MTKNKAWPIALSAIFAGIAIAIVQNKVIPCLDVLQTAFVIDKSTAGWLSSIFSVMSIIAAFPAAIITNRLGVKKTVLYSLVCSVLGTLLGVFSTSVTMLMLSRVIEGVGAGLISIAVPSIISMWFPPEKRGLPTGIWSSWQFVAQALCFFFGVSLTNAFGWRGVWWAGLVFVVIAMVLCIALVRAPKQGEGFSEPAQDEKVSILEGLKSSSTWFASIAMFCFCFSCFGFVTWAAACWNETLGLSLDAANRYVSLFAIISLPVVVVAGLLMDRVNHRTFSLITSFGYIFIAAAAFLLPSGKWVLPFVLIYPFFEGSVSTCLWTIIPQTVKHAKDISTAVALFTLTSNVGMLVGPPVTGWAIEAYGWAAAAVPVAISMVLGTVMVGLTKEYTH